MLAPSAGDGRTSLSSSTRWVGLATAVNTSTVTSSFGWTKAMTGAVANCAAASSGSTVMRAVASCSLVPSVTA